VNNPTCNGHPRRIPPVLTHNQHSAGRLMVVCPILLGWNGCHSCRFPALTHDHADGPVRRQDEKGTVWFRGKICTIDVSEP
jgi:hypothetical protein